MYRLSGLYPAAVALLDDKTLPIIEPAAKKPGFSDIFKDIDVDAHAIRRFGLIVGHSVSSCSSTPGHPLRDVAVRADWRTASSGASPSGCGRSVEFRLCALSRVKGVVTARIERSAFGDLELACAVSAGGGRQAGRPLEIVPHIRS
jgi:hypothetical protein